ncbi:zinc finger BED domain-containing protein 6-like [Trichogramma pretiosum]|uniref:zinc finger BED domain-containing protein 6-like n=1 Tax=Trichogramma pretiosum TaxID=7493 RepID=UPI000C71C73B|nr:zinc finger BED domain-containing protein 6-like [Trichogramma pretiosum]
MISSIKTQLQVAKNCTRSPSFLGVWKKFKNITKDIAFAVVLELLTVTSTEIENVREILRVLEPFYQFPSEKQLLDVIIPQLYEQVKKKVSTIIKNDLSNGVQSIALTIDGWTGRSITDHMTVTVHYWTADFEPRHFLLQLESLPKNWNSAEDLFHLIQNVLLKYGYLKENMTIHIVTTNGDNIVKAISMDDKWIRIPCFARLLQFTIDDVLNSFNDFSNLVTKCHTLVSNIWPSKSDCKESIIDNFENQTCSILDDIVPSWNSTFDMFENLIKLRSSLKMFLRNTPLLPEKLTKSNWESISVYIKIFGLLKQASNLMSKEAYPPLSLYLSTIRGILELIESENWTDKLSAQLINSICSRFSHINISEPIIIAMVADPRFKTHLLLEDEKSTVFDIIKNKMLCVDNIDIEIKCESLKIKNTRELALESYFVDIRKKKVSDIEKMVEAELTYYLHENLVPVDTVVHEWWKSNATRFPKLCKLAKIYLSIPAIQVSSERAFMNKQGFITDSRAEKLTKEVNVLDLMRISFLNQNMNQFKKDIYF